VSNQQVAGESNFMLLLKRKNIFGLFPEARRMVLRKAYSKNIRSIEIAEFPVLRNECGKEIDQYNYIR
jgi:hypothetical protein